MGVFLRASRALLLLAGFYLLCLLVLGVFAGTALAVHHWAPGVAALKIDFILALLALPVVRASFFLRPPQDDGQDGLRVSKASQPELWAVVRQAAEAAGTRAPDEIRLTGAVNAAVSEDARMLGLTPGRRRLRLGVPLLAGLTRAQLMAVLGHEFGHYGNANTRLSAITWRGRLAVTRTVRAYHEQADRRVDKERTRQEKKAVKAVAKGRKAKAVDTSGAGFGHRRTAKVFVAYAKFYLRSSQSVARRQELAADRVSVRIAGRDAAASALRETAALDAAHAFYLRTYATAGLAAGLMPPRGQFYGGLARLLAEPGRQEELAGLRAEPPREETSPYDAHPPTAERIRLIEALPDDGRGDPASSGPAMALLREPERVLGELEDVTLTAESLAMRRVDWPELLHLGRRAECAAGAEPLREAVRQVLGGDATLRALLDAADGGALWRVADALPKSEEASRASGRAAREFLRPLLRSGLAELVILELVDAGLARWEMSWSDGARLDLSDDYGDRLNEALEAAVADTPDTRPLRLLLPRALHPATF
ncbi:MULTISPECIES: M48 family metalloprotease [Streptomyces]|uniref:M48 family metalloprotease n=1 Tax=Streptomyces griseocarneus TaxID=51201 RepID=A0ABX7RS12_9ACTN|nr:MULTISPECIES: M48 family metallopeptidase [Streptomyces]QSY50278.1 M48 family metalloprotease [Streptomyces griseocarneus]